MFCELPFVNIYGEINQVRRALGRRRDHVDRRQIAKVRAAFDRRSDRAPEPCLLSCSGCGALSAPPSPDPHRGIAALRVDPCRYCGHDAWIDLTEDDATRSLAAVEAYEHHTIDPGRRIRHWTLRIGGATTIGLLCAFAAFYSYSFIFSTLTAMVGLVAVCFFSLGYGQATEVVKRSLPYRWSLPLPPTAAIARDGARIEGPVSAGDEELLRAPLSGRPCLAHRVVVRREDAPSNAVPALVTQQSRDLQVQGRTVLGSDVRIDLETHPVTVPQADQASVVAYLRRHGILESEGPWVLEEAVLEPGTSVVVAEAESRGAVLRAA